MKIVVLMSTYNGEKYLRTQIDSILNQEGCDVDLVVRDDGSTDSTIDILQEYMSEGKLLWYKGTNLKPAKSFWDLLLNSGEYHYYCFSDQDDVWDNDKIITGIERIKNDEFPSMYYCNSRLIDEDGRLIGSNTYKASGMDTARTNLLTVLCTGGALGCTMIMNRHLVKAIKTKNLTPDKLIMHDCFIQGLCKSMDGNVVYDQSTHMGYRQHASNVVGRKKGLINALKYRTEFLTRKGNVSIADHAQEILDMYLDYIPQNNIKTIKKVACYKNNLYCRLRLALSGELKCRSIADSLFVRISLLCGSR